MHMENEFKIIGKNLSTEKMKTLEEKYKETKEYAAVPYDSEIEKSDKAKEIIDFVNVCLEKEFDRIGLNYEWIPQGKVHFFLDDDFRLMHPNSEKDSGLYLPVLQEAHILTLDYSERATVFATILHEMIHLVSHNVYFFDENHEEIGNYRSGYHTRRNQDEDGHEHFRGLNEGIIDLVVSEIVNENIDTISQMLDLKEDDWRGVSWYYDEGELINLIIEKISQQKNEPEEVVYKRFKRGLFSGEMMHLRDIEKVFGKDALRIFSYINPRAKSQEELDIQKKAYEFFWTDNQERRNELHDEIIER